MSIADGEATATAFLSRTGTASETLFETLDPEKIGIDFLHIWNKRPGQLRNNTTGCGVAMGDYDGDGLVDVFLPRSTDGGRLYRNLGEFKFQDVTDKAGILNEKDRWTTGASFVDIDNDGDLDLYVCAFDCPNHLYVNSGDGTFEERGKEFGLDYEGSSAMGAFADYDRDGDLDLYLMTNHIPPDEEIEYDLRFNSQGVPQVPQEYRQYHDTLRLPDGSYGVIESGQYDHLYRNNGDGTFVEVTEQAGVTGNHKGLGVTWWDYNQDGWPDVYVANDFYGPDRLYHNNRDGTFTDVAAENLPHTPWFSMGCDLGDLNNDGLFDFMATDMSASNHQRFNETMGDVHTEGWFLELPTPRQYMRNAVYVNTGVSRMMEAAYLTGLESTDWTWSVRFVDLDQDGKVDLHVTNGMSRDWGNSDLKAKAMALGPLNSEIYNEFWDNQPPLRERNFAFRNRGDLQFENVSSKWGLNYLGVSFGAAFGDLDGDGDLDLVINNFQDKVSVCRNNGTAGNAVRIRLIGQQSNRWGIGSTVRMRTGDQWQSRYLTLARGFMSASDPTVHFGLGDAETIDELVVEWPSGRRQALTNLKANQFYSISESADSTEDERNDASEKPLFVRSDQTALSSEAHHEQPFDDFAREPLLPYRLSRMGPGIAVGDVNGDKVDDLYLSEARAEFHSGVLLASDEAGTWQVPDTLFPPWSEKPLVEELGALLFDADADGDMDLYIASGGVECEPDDETLQDRLFINDGAGNFVAAAAGTLPELRVSRSVVAAADYDRDGDLDLFVGGRCIPGRYPETPPSTLLNNQSGKFSDATQTDAPSLQSTGLVTSGLWSDVNADGWIDLLVTHDWGPIKLFLNNNGKLRDATADAGLADQLGWWSGIAGRDLDGDGDIDYVATNLGRNTVYRVDKDHPAKLFYGDFNENGQPLLVAGRYDSSGRVVPTRSKPELQRAIPHIEISFPTFKEYAAASLEDILGQALMESALTLEANMADSVVLRNSGSGSFTVEPLPLSAQVAPGFGVVINDFNGDGYADACIAQNNYAPRREIGRWDGGVSILLVGDKSGNLKPVPAINSGLCVPADAKSLVSLDVNQDHWPDLVVGVNDGSPLVFESQPSPGLRTVSIRLAGPKGNPTCVGARVTVRRSDGWNQTAEVQAGGGYLSQQPATLSFGLGRDHNVQEVEVRWPDGRSTRHETDPDEPVIELAQP